MDTGIIRCDWVPLDSELMKNYHDNEWGVALHDDVRLFEALILDGAQAGLSWNMILEKRENYRNAFAQFDAHELVKFDNHDVERLMGDSGIVRNRAKIRSALHNAQCFLETQKEFGSFDAYIWRFKNETEYKKYYSYKDIPTQTADSVAMSKDLKKRGFTFVGPTICYAFMQAVGVVDDHTLLCHKTKH